MKRSRLLAAIVYIGLAVSLVTPNISSERSESPLSLPKDTEDVPESLIFGFEYDFEFLDLLQTHQQQPDHAPIFFTRADGKDYLTVFTDKCPVERFKKDYFVLNCLVSAEDFTLPLTSVPDALNRLHSDTPNPTSPSRSPGDWKLDAALDTSPAAIEDALKSNLFQGIFWNWQPGTGPVYVMPARGKLLLVVKRRAAFDFLREWDDRHLRVRPKCTIIDYPVSIDDFLRPPTSREVGNSVHHA